jgi:hypothetical protein
LCFSSLNPLFHKLNNRSKPTSLAKRKAYLRESGVLPPEEGDAFADTSTFRQSQARAPPSAAYLQREQEIRDREWKGATQKQYRDPFSASHDIFATIEESVAVRGSVYRQSANASAGGGASNEEKAALAAAREAEWKQTTRNLVPRGLNAFHPESVSRYGNEEGSTSGAGDIIGHYSAEQRDSSKTTPYVESEAKNAGNDAWVRQALSKRTFRSSASRIADREAIKAMMKKEAVKDKEMEETKSLMRERDPFGGGNSLRSYTRSYGKFSHLLR